MTQTLTGQPLWWRARSSRWLVELLRNGSDQSKAIAARELGNFAASKDANKAAIVAEGALPALVKLLRNGSDQSKAIAAKVLGKLAAGNDGNKAAILAARVLP
jgi:hypothetical protein